VCSSDLAVACGRHARSAAPDLSAPGRARSPLRAVRARERFRISNQCTSEAKGMARAVACGRRARSDAPDLSAPGRARSPLRAARAVYELIPFAIAATLFSHPKGGLEP
jgi:hypothetical protein